MPSVQDEFEDYLATQMATLCPDRGNQSQRAAAGVGLFDTITSFERVIGVLGVGAVGPMRVIDDAPESLRLSAEHRYSLSRWPDFELVILESNEGVAWGQTFSRRSGTAAPPINGVDDLGRWSHVESEVRAAFGKPVFHEGWPPWESSVYVISGTEFLLCFVYGLLQSVRSREP